MQINKIVDQMKCSQDSAFILASSYGAHLVGLDQGAGIPLSLRQTLIDWTPVAGQTCTKRQLGFCPGGGHGQEGVQSSKVAKDAWGMHIQI